MKPKTFSTGKYAKRGFEGCDASLDISLNEYGLIWKKYKRANKKKGFAKDEYLFIYINSRGELDWCGNIHETTNIKDYFAWADITEVAVTSGFTVERWLSQSIPDMIMDLIYYYGTINVFGR